ncbi:MAG: GatB/YqeY domain-containing protein [Syntrophomonadaceae bacterium]|nr:GatB/YqeY domain-containing protein [Syntrophomonadaceae bacterium]
MSLTEQLLADMKEAMKQREAGKVRLSTIRMVRAAQKKAEIDKGREMTDEEMIDIINREVKKRQDALPDYEKANRPESVKQLHEEINILQGYLPEPLSTETISVLIKETIEELGANRPQDMGKVMKTVMPRLKGRADGKLVNQLVKEMLQ